MIDTIPFCHKCFSCQSFLFVSIFFLMIIKCCFLELVFAIFSCHFCSFIIVVRLSFKLVVVVFYWNEVQIIIRVVVLFWIFMQEGLVHH